jgi:hypothetical protein
MLNSTYEVHFASILLEDDDFGRHIEDLEISIKLYLKLHCYKCSLHKSTLYIKKICCMLCNKEKLQIELPFSTAGGESQL